MKRTERGFDTLRRGRTENQSPVSVTTVEERMFSTGNRDMVVYLELSGIERKGRIGTKGKRIGYLAYVENVRRRVGAHFV